MTDEQKGVYVSAMVACANIEVEAMKVANEAARSVGTLKYSEQDFRDVIDRHGIHHNAVIGLFHSL